MALRVKTIWSLRKTNLTLILRSIHLNVSFVLDAFVPAKKRKGLLH